MTVWESVTKMFSTVFTNGWNFAKLFYEKLGILPFITAMFVIYLSLRFVIFPLISRGFSYAFNNGLDSVQSVKEIKLSKIKVKHDVK